MHISTTHVSAYLSVTMCAINIGKNVFMFNVFMFNVNPVFVLLYSRYF